MKAKKNGYEVLMPLFEKHAWDMNKTEVKQYFNWFVLNVPDRARYVIDKVAEELEIDMSNLMYKKESLIYIWEWFLVTAEVETPKKSWLRRFEEVEDETFSALTEFIIRDIGMYVGQMFVENFKSVEWIYYTTPKNDFYVNTPVLADFYDRDFNPPFKMILEPVGMVRKVALNIFESTQDKKDLLNLYEEWMRKV